MRYIYSIVYYLAIKIDKIMSFAATLMELEILILNKVNQKETNSIWYHLYEEFEYGTDVAIYKIVVYFNPSPFCSTLPFPHW